MELILKNPEANSLVSVVNIPHNFVPKSLMKNKNGYLVEIDNSKYTIDTKRKNIMLEMALQSI